MPEIEISIGEFYMHSECHPVSATWIKWKDGVYDLICAECEEVIIPDMLIEWGNKFSLN